MKAKPHRTVRDRSADPAKPPRRGPTPGPGRLKTVLVLVAAAVGMLLAFFLLNRRGEPNPVSTNLAVHSELGNSSSNLPASGSRHPAHPSGNQTQVIRKLNEANQLLAEGRPGD